MLSIEKINDLLTEFKQKNNEEYQDIDKVILPQYSTERNQTCQYWNAIDENIYKDANINSNVYNKKGNYNICQPMSSSNNNNQKQDLKCFIKGGVLSNCDNNIPYHYQIPFTNSDKINMIKEHRDEYNKNEDEMNTLNNKFLDLITSLQELKNQITDSNILNGNNKKLKSIINKTDNNKTGELDEKNKEIMIEKSKLDELSEQNIKIEEVIRRLSSIAKFVFILMILIMLISNITKLNLTASIALALFNIGLLALIYLLVFENKSYFTKIIPSVKD